MAKKRIIEESGNGILSTSTSRVKKYFVKFLTEAQQEAWEIYRQSQIMFLMGAAGTGKTHLAMAFAVQEILAKEKSKIIVCRPIVEAGENLGFLPGDMNEKVAPYMLPLYDCLNNICGKSGEQSREYIEKRIEIAPLAFMRGRTFSDAVCILDEAQNCTRGQLKLFLSRLGQNSRMIITGDPTQSDLATKPDIVDVVDAVKDIQTVGHIYFSDADIVRNPIIGEILRRI